MFSILHLFFKEEYLGRLVLQGTDQPFYHCDFEPTPEFARFRPYFDQECRDFEGLEDDDPFWTEHDYSMSDFILINPDNGERIEGPLLHIEENFAWFRY